jgi:nitroreductase
LGADATFQDCRVGSPWIVIVATILGLALIGLGALESWRVYVVRDEGAPRRTVAAVSLMAAALFALAVILPFVAALIIPGCWQ